MVSNSELVEMIVLYIEKNKYATAYDIVRHFSSMGIPDEKVLFVLKEIHDT